VSRICALSPTTVGDLRRRLTVQSGQSTFRIGHDGRLRAYHPPDQTGKQTTPRVRGQGQPSEADHAEPPEKERDDVAPTQVLDGAAHWWVSDPALTDRCRELVAWFERSHITLDDFAVWTEDFPMSRIFEVADEATRRAHLLLEIAATIQHRKNA
jgi:hypothetical protein